MFLYFGKNFTATASGAKIKPVHCEKCAAEFFYELRRMGTGQGTAPYMIGLDSAKNRAETAAQKNLAKLLSTHEDLVACPACHWVNESAVRRLRRSKYLGAYWLSILVLFIASLIVLFLYFDARDVLGHQPTLDDPAIHVVAAIAAGAVFLFLLVQHLLRRRINPNRQLVDGLPRLPPGTPPALLKDAQGNLVPAPGSINLPTDATWAIFRAGQLVFERLCCQCLDAQTHHFKLPMTMQAPLAVPLCRACYRRLQMQFWLRNLAMVPVAFLLAWLLAQWPRQIDDTGRIMMTCFVGFFFSLVGFGIVDYWLKPYRLGVVDKQRGVGRIRFKNPAYTAVLIRKIGEADGLC